MTFQPQAMRRANQLAVIQQQQAATIAQLEQVASGFAAFRATANAVHRGYDTAVAGLQKVLVEKADDAAVEELRSSYRQLQPVQGQVATLTIGLDEQEGRITNVLSELARMDEINDSLTSQLDAAMSDVAAMESRIAEIDELQARIDVLQHSPDPAPSTAPHVFDEVEALQVQGSQHASDISDLQTAMATLQIMESEARAQIASALATIEQFAETSEQLQTTLVTVQGQVNAALGGIVSLQNEVTATQDTISAVQATVGRLSDATTTANSGLSTLQGAMAAVQSTGSALQTAMASANANIASLTSQHSALATSVSSLATRVGTLETRTPWIGLSARVLGAVPTGTTEHVTTWDTPASSNSYAVAAAISLGPSLVGKATARVKAGSKTITGCTVEVINTGQVAIGAGAVLQVIGVK